MKNILLLLATLVVASRSHAQKGTDDVAMGGVLSIPTGDFGDLTKVGFGGYAKAMVGVFISGRISLTSGYTSNPAKYLPTAVSAAYYIIPILVGYRHNVEGFFIEPQLGIGIYGAKARYNGQSSSDSKSGFTCGGGAGYKFAPMELDLTYHYTKLKDADSPITVFGVRLGYLIPLKGS